jgi:hypothetical protein
MTWIPDRDDAAEKARFIEIYGEDLWNQIQELTAPKPLAAREVLKPKQPAPTQPAANDRPALQTEGSDDPAWWEK